MGYLSNGQQYAQTADLYSVITAAALNHPSTNSVATQNAALLRASEFMDGFLRDQYVLPLQTWGSDVVQACCDIAAYRLVCLRGFNPEADGMYSDNHDRAVKWLGEVAKGVVSPDVVDASPSPTPGQHAPPAEPQSYSPHRRTRGTSRR